MIEFYTIIAEQLASNGGIYPYVVMTADTDVNPNSHKSVRSYKTYRVALRGIAMGTKMPGVARYRVLRTVIHDNGHVSNEWMET